MSCLINRRLWGAPCKPRGLLGATRGAAARFASHGAALSSRAAAALLVTRASFETSVGDGILVAAAVVGTGVARRQGPAEEWLARAKTAWADMERHVDERNAMVVEQGRGIDGIRRQLERLSEALRAMSSMPPNEQAWAPWGRREGPPGMVFPFSW